MLYVNPQSCLKGVHTYALPFANPTVFGAHHRNQSIKVSACTIVYVVFVVFHAKKFFAVVASIVFKLFKRLQINGLVFYITIEVNVVLWGLGINALKMPTLTLTREHTRHARNPRKSFGIASKAIFSLITI